MNTQPPKDIDEIIEKFLRFANDVVNNNDSEPKDVCQLGWLVLKIKEDKIKAASTAKPLAAIVTDNTLQQIEREGKLG